MKGLRVIVYGLWALLLIGCGQPAPQRPTQRKSQAPAPDSAQLALMELNMQLAQTADVAVRDAAQAQPEAYALYEGQVWMTIQGRGDETQTLPPAGQACMVRMRIYTLRGELLEDTERTYTLGKRELPTGVEDNIGELHPGAQARMIMPWYAAYGAQGTAHIPPYENVMIDLEIR